MSTETVFDGLDGKVALVSGGSKGIGRAIALALAEQGVHVAVVGRNRDDLERTREAISSHGVQSLAVSADLGAAHEVRRAFDEVRGSLGRVDILVNNAAAKPTLGPLVDCSEEAWDKLMAVNVKAYFLLTQLAIRDMIPRSWGRVINVSSSTGLKARRNMGEYAVTKAAEIMLTRSFAVEVGAGGITVNAIAPVLTNTDFSERQRSNPEEVERILSMQAIPHMAEPSDMVGAALLLASDAGRMITGHTLVVDGGLLA